MRVQQLKWVLAFVAALLVGAAGVVIVLSLMGGGGGQATAQPVGPTPLPLATLPTDSSEDTPPAGPTAAPGATEQPATPNPVRPAATYYPIHIPTLPPDFTLREKRPCPDKWQRISDDVLNYSICIPPDWGILDEKTGDRSTELTDHARGLKILSPEGFPYPVGAPLDKLLQDPNLNLIWITLGSASPTSSINCQLVETAPLNSLPATQCQIRFNYTDWGDQDLRPDGSILETDIVVPLPNPAAGLGGPRTGYALLIGIIGNEKAMEVHRDTISQIIKTVEGQP